VKLKVQGQIFPRARSAALKVRKIGEKRRKFNLGSQTLSFSVYEIEIPDDCEVSGGRIKLPSGLRLYHNFGGQYEAGYLIAETDEDPLVRKHF